MASVSHNVRVSRPFLPTTGSSGDKYAKRLRGGAPFERRHCHSRIRKRPAIRVACNNNNNSNNNRNTIRASAVVRVLLFRSTPPPRCDAPSFAPSPSPRYFTCNAPRTVRTTYVRADVFYTHPKNRSASPWKRTRGSGETRRTKRITITVWKRCRFRATMRGAGGSARKNGQPRR